MYDYLVFLPQQACDFGSFISTTFGGNLTNPLTADPPRSPSGLPHAIIKALDKNYDDVLTFDETVCLQRAVFEEIAGSGSSITAEKLLAYLNVYQDFHAVFTLLPNGTTVNKEYVVAIKDPDTKTWVTTKYNDLLPYYNNLT
eukprot:747340-Hanusia_phi.AAC.1